MVKITQIESIHYKKFERMLNSFERRFFRAPNQIISLVARVKGLISEEDLRISLDKVRQQHPLLGVRIYLDENNDAWYTTENVPENQLRIVERTSESDWNRELSKEYGIRFELGTGPLVRFVLLQSEEISEIIIVCHHVICDGTSLTILARDILMYLGDANRDVQEMQEPPLATSENFQSEINLGKAMQFAIKKMNSIWGKDKVVFDDEDEDNLFKAFLDAYTFKIITVELNENETSLFVEKCRQNEVTVNSALNMAFLAAHSSILSPFKGGKQNVMVPVNTRNRYKKPVGENFGLYVAGFQFKITNNPKKNFWENAKMFDKGLKDNLNIDKIFKFAALTELIDPSLVDARNFSFFGKKVPSDYSRYEKIHAFSTNEKNIVNKRAKKQIPKLPGLAITNLGQMDYPTKYGSLELDRFIFITSATPFIELVIPVVTVAGKLTFTINYLEETTDTSTMKKIKDKALEYIELAEYKESAN